MSERESHKGPFPADALAGTWAGEASPTERAKAEEWLCEVPEDGERLRAAWELSGEISAPADVEVAWTTLQARIATSRGADSRVASRTASRIASRTTRTMWQRTAQWGAALIGVSACLIMGWWITTHSAGPSALTTATYHTAAAEQRVIRLADGSTMTLAPATTVHVTDAVIDVDGEALFDVSPRASRPFIVQTGNTTVQVLGTVFTVRHYAEDAATRVVVVAGKVRVHARRDATQSSGAIVTPHMLADVSDSGVAVTHGITTDEYTGWTRGTLAFHWTPLGDVITELNRAYGADIRVSDSALARKRMRLDVSVSEQSLFHVLDLVSLSADAHYSVNGRAIVLSPGRIVSAPTAEPRRMMYPQSESGYGR